MDRVIVSPDELLLDTDVLKSNRNTMVGLAKLSSALLGTATQLNGLSCIPTSPATMSVTVGAGEIYQLLSIDATAYGTLPIDTHQILKQGIVLDAQNFSCPAPGSVGFSINYLIQVTLSEADIGGTSRAFYNSANPDGLPPIFQTVNQTRQDLCDVRVKAGSAATTGTQTTPAPDSGFVGAWVITVANGQTTITSGNISLYPSAPFIAGIISNFLTQAQGDIRYGQKTDIQAGVFNYAQDSGTANNYAVALTPAPTSLIDGMTVWMNAAHANTGSSTLNVNALGSKSIYKLTNSAINTALAANDILAGGQYQLIYNAALTAFILKDPSTDGFKQLLANSGYTVFPNGIIMQWSGTIVPVAGICTWTLPIAFTSQIYSVLGNVGANDSTDFRSLVATIVDFSSSLSQIKMASSLSSAASTNNIYMFAIGI